MAPVHDPYGPLRSPRPSQERPTVWGTQYLAVAGTGRKALGRLASNLTTV
jgi:hypothetical protein